MRDKLLDLMKNEGLKPSQLAEMLEINPAGVSHILAGRNKPGFDLLQKILRRFPQINPDWLLLDSPKMYREDQPPRESFLKTHLPRSQQAAQPRQPEPSLDGLFSESGRTPSQSPQPGNPGMAQPMHNEIPVRPETDAQPGARKIDHVVIFYDDRTFESYSPTKR